MEKHKNSIDNLFREVLHDHEIVPSDHAKEAFLKEVSQIPPRRWNRGGIFLLIILAILVIIGGFAIYFFREQPSFTGPVAIKAGSIVNPDDRKTSSPDALKPAIINSNNIINHKTSVNTNQTIQSSNHLQRNKVSMNTPDHDSDPLKSVQMTDTLVKTFHLNQHKPSTREIILSETITLPATATSAPSSIITSSDTSRVILNTSYDTIVAPPKTLQKKEKKQRLNKDWYFSVAAQYTPEWMFNTLEEGKFVNNFGLEGIFTFGKYSIRTGLGLSITEGTNELAVEYNDYLGSYNKLDSMSFSWDGAIYDFVPTYYLKSEVVYDSLMKIDYLKVVKRYTYLQIPLVLGYDLLCSGRFSIGLRAGPVLSVLLNTKQLSEEYDPGDKKVISINNISPEQVSLNWQFMGGINASVRLSEILNFEIEPMAKYYFNSVYEKSDITKKPWSIGIRGAFIIKL